MKFGIYTDKSNEHRWRALSRNGKCVADSGEGYSSKGNATKALKTFIAEVCKAGVFTDITDETPKVVAKKVVAKKVVAKSAPRKVVSKRAAMKVVAKRAK